MIRKKYRLTTDEIRLLHTHGRVVRLPGFLIRYSHSTAVTSARFAVIAPKAYAKNRVARHAYTRTIYRALAPLAHTFAPGVYNIYCLGPSIDEKQLAAALTRLQAGL